MGKGKVCGTWFPQIKKLNLNLCRWFSKIRITNFDL